MKIKQVALFAGVALAALAAMPAQAQQTTVLKFSSWLPPMHPIMQGMVVPWGKQIDEVTKGRVKLEIMPSSLGPPQAQFDIAKDGLADVAVSVHGYTPGRFTLTDVVELPFLGDKAEPISVAYWRVHQAMLTKADEHKGVKMVAVFSHGPGHILNIKKPIRSLDDMNGLKFRVGGGMVNTIAKELGVVPVLQPATKAYEILSTGVADGLLFPTESVAFFKLDKLIKYATIVPKGLYNTSFFIVMNQAKWDALSADDKKAIEPTMHEAWARMAGKAWDAADLAGHEAMKAAGIQSEPMSADFQKAVAAKLTGVEKEFIEKAKAKGVDGAAAIAMLKAEIAKETK